jgi:hypothetical protein
MAGASAHPEATYNVVGIRACSGRSVFTWFFADCSFRDSWHDQDDDQRYLPGFHDFDPVLGEGLGAILRC